MTISSEKVLEKGRLRSNALNCRISDEALQYLGEFKKLTGLPTGQAIELWASVVSNVDPDDVIRIWGQRLSSTKGNGDDESRRRYLARVKESKTMSQHIKKRAINTIKLLVEDYLQESPRITRLSLKSKLLHNIPSYYSPTHKEIWRREIDSFLEKQYPDRNISEAKEITPSLFEDDMF
jgi:hypothetical protein